MAIMPTTLDARELASKHVMEFKLINVKEVTLRARIVVLLIRLVKWVSPTKVIITVK